jgi:DNA adenine methylase
LTLIPDHHTYVEVFSGSAKLLFAKAPAKFEVLNDKNGEVTNFFRVCKHRTSELAELLELECIHADRFRELRNGVPTDELERALRFVYLTWYSFGGKGEHFAQSSAAAKSVRKPITRVRALLAETARRLASVQIETQDFSTILRRYDADTTFFYLDPPYVAFGSNGRYEPMTVAAREGLFSQLAGLRGRFLLSFDDHPEIQRRAADYGLHVRQVSVLYSLSGRSEQRKRAAELLMANYPIAPE